MNSGVVHMGCVLPQVGPAASPALVCEIAHYVEAMNWHSLWVTDRLLYPCQPASAYPGTYDGSLPSAYQHVLDPLICLALAAQATQRVTLGTCVLNAPFYKPLLLARQLTTIDLAAAGRLRLGLGLGWSADEFAALGIPMAERARRCTEVIAALKTIWTQDVVERAGMFPIPASIIGPKPAQRPHPPVYLASFVDAGLARVAQLADGWIWTGVDLFHLTTSIQRLYEHAAAAERDLDTIRIIVRLQVDVTARVSASNRLLGHGCVEQIVEDLATLAAVGVHEIIVDPTFTTSGATPEGWFSVLDQLGEQVTQIQRPTMVEH